MGNVRHLNQCKNEVIEVLEKALDEARRGEIGGIILICQREDGAHTADWPGEFSTDMEDIAALVGHLTLASNYFAMFALSDDDYE